MNATLASVDSWLKPRSVHLLPKCCIAIRLSRQNSPVLSTPPSSLSSASNDPFGSDHCELSPRLLWREVNKCSPSRQTTLCENCCGNQNDGAKRQQVHSPQSMDRQSFSSISTVTTLDNRECPCHQPINCAELFNEFLKENMFGTTFLYPTNSLSKLDLVGFIYPGTLLVSGQQESLDLLCSLWSKRILKAPVGYAIRFLGPTSVLEVSTINQSHFTPLAEALHRCVDELNSKQEIASFDAIVRQLRFEFPNMELPSEEILKSSLNNLVLENKLSFDYQCQVYLVTRALDGPCDDFENLTLSDNCKSDKENCDIELNCKQANTQLGEMYYEKNQTYTTTTTSTSTTTTTSTTESTTMTDCKLDKTVHNNGKLLRRNSSFSDEIDKVNTQQRRANFRRSKSFKLTYKSNSNENGSLIDKDCTCEEINNKRQSLLRKLLKFGHSSGQVKTRSISSPIASSSLPIQVNFGSQFPEESNTCAVIPYNESFAQRQVERHSKATQTVKCGPEDMVTLIMKQAGRHALVRNRPSHHHHRQNVERAHLEPGNCCCSRLVGHCGHCENGNHWFVTANRHKESRSGSTRRSRHKHYYLSGEKTDCAKCQSTNANGLTSELSPCSHYQSNSSRHRDHKYRKPYRHASQRSHFRTSEWVLEYDRTNQHNHNEALAQTPNEQAKANLKPLFRDAFNFCDDEFNLDRQDERERHQHVQCFIPNGELNRLNGSKVTNGIETETMTKETIGDECHNKHNNRSCKHETCGNILINNSVNLKIEIETSNISASVTNNGDIAQMHPPTTTTKYLSESTPNFRSQEANNRIFLDKNLATLSNKMHNGPPEVVQYANDIYSELTFTGQGHHHHQSNSVTGMDRQLPQMTSKGGLHGRVNGNSSYNVELNYANSIAALKEQIARAKANFFNAPLSSPTTR